MKKFSKFITRHLATRSSSSPISERHRRFGREHLNLHQLTSSRFLLPPGTADGNDLAVIDGKTNFLVDEGSKVCERCKHIDVEKLLGWEVGQPRAWVELSHVFGPIIPPKPVPKTSLDQDGQETDTATEGDAESVVDEGCPYCAFFRALLGHADDETGKFAPYLRIRLAFEVTNVKETHELGRAVLMEVMTRNKTLPWGYVVKAAADEGRSLESYSDEEGTKAELRGRVVGEIIDLDAVKTWIDHCQGNHTSDAGCARAWERVEGLRLVDCQRRSIISADLDEVTEYATLSYAHDDTQETTSSEAADVLPKNLPPLFQDAIALSLSLGYRYLWIDTYCFTPLDEEVKQAQKPLLGDIFASAGLTLVIAAGKGTTTFIPGVSAPRQPQLTLQTPSGLFTTTMLRPDIEYLASAHARQGWTYQEIMLSRRRLIITPSQAYFQCEAMHCYESVSLPLRVAPDVGLGRLFPNPALNLENIEDEGVQVWKYMGRDIRPGDRLDAFKAVLRRYEHSDIWTQSFLGTAMLDLDRISEEPLDRVVTQTDRMAIALSWTPSAPSHHATSPCAHIPSSPFPSWTWLSWHARVSTQKSPGALTLGLPRGSIHKASASPGMEVGVGFKDGAVLNWEADGDGIAARPEEDVEFLRLKALCFDINIRRLNISKRGDVAGEQGWCISEDSVMDDQGKEMVESWLRDDVHADEVERLTEGEESDGSGGQQAEDEDSLLGILLAGRNWSTATSTSGTATPTGSKTPASGKNSSSAVKGTGASGKNHAPPEEPITTVLVCRKGPALAADGGRRLRRLGVLTLQYDTFAHAADGGGGDGAVLRGVWGEPRNKKDLRVQIREVDVY